MKKLTASLLLILVSAAAFSEESESVSSSKISTNTDQTVTKTLPRDDEKSPKAPVQGARVALINPFLNTKASLKYAGLELGNITSKNNNNIGASVGYASLPLQEIGWTASGSYFNVEFPGASAGLLRLDGNLGTSLTKIFNVKAGVNISKFITGSSILKKLTPGIGLQASMGLQFTPNIGLEVGYVSMTQTQSYEGGASLEVKESGPEIGLAATF